MPKKAPDKTASVATAKKSPIPSNIMNLDFRALHTIVSNAPLVLYVIGMDGIFAVSEGLGLKGIGLKPGEAVGQSVFDMYKDFPDIVKNIRAAMDGNSVSYVLDIADRQMEHNHSPILNQDGEQVGILGISIDITDRVDAEQAYRLSSERYQSLFENNAAAMAIYNLDTTIAEVNEAYCELTGFSREEVIGKKWTEQVPPDELKRLQQYNKERLNASGKVPDKYEFSFLHKSGEIKHAMASFKMINDNKQIQAVYQDVSDRYKAEEVLRETEAQYKSLFDNMREGLAYCKVIYDKQGLPVDWTYLEVNEAYLQITGLRNVEGRRLSEVMPTFKKANSDMFNALTGVARSGKPVKKEAYLVTIKRWLRVSIFSPATDYFVAVIENISETKEAEAKEIAIKDNFKFLFENMTQGVVVMAADGRIIDTNEAGVGILGLTRDQLLGKTSMDPRWRAIHENGTDWPGQDHPGPVSLKTGKAINEVVQGIFDPERNQYRWILVSATPRLKPGEKKPYETVVTFTEITTLKATEQKLSRQAQTIKGIINSTGGPVFSLDRKYRYTSFNETHAVVMKQLYGAKLEPGKNMLDYMTVPTDRKIAKINIEKALNGERVVEEAFSGTEGRRAYFEVSHNPIMGDEGKIIGVGIMARDLTEKRTAEIALKESESRYRGLFGNMREGFAFCRAIYDKKGRLIDWIYVDTNAAFEKITGLKKVVGKRITDILPNHRTENPELFELYEGVLKSGKPTDIETYVEPLQQWLHISIFSPAKEHFAAVFEHITIKKLSEEKQRLEVETSQSLLRLHEETAGMNKLNLYDFILDIIIKLTGSEVGFFHEVSDDTDSVTLTAWNKTARENCTTPSITHYPYSDAGNWLDCLRERRPIYFNNYEKSPNRKGLPKGHFPLSKFLSFPVFHEGKIRYVFGVGNKTSDYTDEDVVQTTIIAEGMLRVLLAREAAEAIELGEKRTRAIIDNAPFGAIMYRLEPDDRLVYVAGNESADRILGIKCDQFIGKTIEEAFPDLTRTELPDMYRRAARTGELYTTQQVSYDAEGITGIFQVQASQTAPMQMVAFFMDVTETAKARLNLEKSEKKYRDIFNNATEGIIQATIEGELITANPRFVKMLGYDTLEEFGQRITNLELIYINPKDRETFVREILHKGSVINYEVEMRKRDGKHIWVSIHSTLVAGEQGEQPYIESLMEDITDRRRAESKLIESRNDLEEALSGLVSTLALTVETRDPYTSEHQKRVCSLAIALAKKFKMTEKEIEGLRIAATIHDIGKFFVPTEILSKPGRLTDLEFELIKTHPQAGYDIIKDIKFSEPIAEIILQHHERVNGSGYPSGLAGEETHFRSKVLAVADVVEAMCAHRPYRPALGLALALDEIEKNSGKLYDPEIAAACLDLFRSGAFTFK